MNPPIGAVLRIRFYLDDSESKHKNGLGRKHPWVVVTESDEESMEFYVERLFPAELGEWNEEEIDPSLDKFDVIPPEKWPDKVCAAMALRSLT